MRSENPRFALGYHGNRPASRVSDVLAKVLSVVAGAAVLVGAIAVSVVLFVIAVSAVLVFGAIVWWKTRPLRKQIRETMHESARQRDLFDEAFGEGDIIEGEVVRDVPERRESHGSRIWD
jgi:uncharacterized membrane protein